MKLRIGITGQEGFVGQHLYNTLGLFPDEFERTPYHIDYFADESKLNAFVNDCDVIVHLAAMNRHNDPEVLYNTNIGLVKQLISALEITSSKKNIYYSLLLLRKKETIYMARAKKRGENYS